jgi:hypothetical protein
MKVLPASSAETASVALSQRFFKTSRIAVVCRADDYESALIAAPVARLSDAPLIYFSGSSFGESALKEFKRLGVAQVIAVGAVTPKFKGTVVSLAGSAQAMAWARKKNLKVSYLAAVNPYDREKFTTRKLSMVGAQLAAGRGGLVVPLAFKVEWKRPFESRKLAGALPSGVPSSERPAKAGTIEIGQSKIPFVLTGGKDEDNLKLSLDKSGTGSYSRPVVSGDVVEIGGRRWSVSLGTRTKFGATDVHLTWPTVDEMRSRLEAHYQALGSTPEHLCLVGYPDSLPHAIIGRGGVVEEQASDLPFSMIGKGEFAEIGVGRIVAEDVSFGSLYAARALTYRELRSPAWSNTAGMAEWENSMGPLFENVGFKSPYHLSGEDVPWKVAPVDGKGGTRAASFGQSSPLASAAVLSHSQHSWWRSLGDTFTWEADVLMAPTVVESGGCGTACLDRESDNRSVVARLLRLGAISFTGGSRELSAEAQPLRMEFWNGSLSGLTLGQAHRRAWNSGLVVSRELGEGASGAARYCTTVWMLFGDPALVMSVPSAPRTAPARTELRGDRVSVFGPARWTSVKTNVPPDWTKWAGRDLYAVRGSGAFSRSSWSGEGRDIEVPLVMAEFRTARRVRDVRLVDSPMEPMGWSGKWICSANADGSWTTRFLVRMVDFDQERGKILGSVDRLDFDLIYE